MALCLSEPVHHHRTGGVDLPASVFHRALQELHIRMRVYYGVAYVLSRQEYLGNALQQVRAPVLRRPRVYDENRVSRPWNTSLAFCSMGSMFRIHIHAGWTYEESRVRLL